MTLLRYRQCCCTAAFGPVRDRPVLTGAAMIVMTLFEVFVAVLQAYIFTILSAVYIKLSIEAH